MKDITLFGLSDRQLIALLIVVCLGLFLRMGMVDMVEDTVPIRNDALEYYSYATNMKIFGTYSLTWPGDLIGSETLPEPDRERPPGYALFLYPFITWPPTEAMVHSIRTVQVVLDTLTIFLSFFVFRNFLPFAPAFCATVLVALSPHLVSMNIYLLSETLFTFNLMLFILVAIRAMSRGSGPLTFFAGCLLGTSMLIKPTMNPYVVFLAALLLFHQRRRFDVRFLSVLVLGLVLVISPWIARNIATGFPEVNEPKSLRSLQSGSYPGLMYEGRPETRAVPHRADPNYENITTYGAFLDDLTSKVAEDPLAYLNWYAFGKLKMLLSWDIVAGAGDIFVYNVGYSPYEDRLIFSGSHSLMKLLHPALMVLALLGLIQCLLVNRIDEGRKPENVSLTVLASVLFFFIVLHVITMPLPRYMIPIRPIMYGFAVYTVVKLLDLVSRRLSQMKSGRLEEQAPKEFGPF